MSALNENQKRAIYFAFRDIDRQLSDMESTLSEAERPSVFSGIVNDLAPTEIRVLRDYFARIRSAMIACLKASEIALDNRQSSLRWAIQTRLMFIRLPLEEISPKRLQGYGAIESAGADEVLKCQDEVGRFIDRAAMFVRQGLGRDVGERLARLDAATADVETLKLLEQVTTKWGLIEFRPQLDTIARRYEKPRFEIAVFGRVSSGKSTLLNHLAGTDVLPVGVTPITAVPTRMERGDQPECIVSFAESDPARIELSRLREYASEEGNPGNHRHVTDIIVRLPSPRLRHGVTFVDTPGVGSLALAGAAETYAYLPRCDLGVVLIDASSAPNEEDLAIVRRLYEAGVPAQILLSKVDLVPPAERQKFVEYVRDQLRRHFEIELPIYPISSVGADEQLLTQWYDQQIEPLLERARELAHTSLRRKIAALRESVLATLETMKERPREESLFEIANQAKEVLDSADKAARDAKAQAWNWLESDHGLVETVVRDAARELVRSNGSASKNDPIRAALGLGLSARAQQALSLIEDLKRKLGDALSKLNEAGLGIPIDATSVTNLQISGMPDMDLTQVRFNGRLSRPWWADMAPTVAMAVSRRSMRHRVGSTVAEAVGQYDHQLQLWLRRAVGSLVDAYETQAGVIREHLRRLESDLNTSASGRHEETLIGDLEKLRGAGEPLKI
jgi:small GTP-binding protein